MTIVGCRTRRMQQSRTVVDLNVVTFKRTKIGQTNIQSGKTGDQTSCHRFMYSTLENLFILCRIKSETNMESCEGPPA